MARQGWGRHSTVATGSDSGDQVSVNSWNADINKAGMLGFTGETIASATSITPTATTLILSGSTNVSTIAITNTAEYDLLYIFTSGSVTLVNTTSPSTAGDIKLLANADTDLSTTVPTILIRKGDFWYEYGGSPVTNSSITFAKIQDLATMKVIGRTAASNGVSSEVAILDEDNMASDSAVSLATQQSIKAYVDAQSHSTVTASSTTTFTNKTIDQDATGNSITNIADASIKASAAIAQSKILNLTTDLSGKSPTAGNGSLVTVGALNSGSITSGFGNINIGSSTITTTGAVATGAITAGGTISGNLTGNVTGNASGTAATVTGAAQSAITSVGTLTTLTVDNLTINANKIESINAGGAIELAPKTTGVVTVIGNTNDGAITLNCTSNTHGQTIKSQPHSATATNTMLLPLGANSTLVSLVSTDTLTNKTLTAPVVNVGSDATGDIYYRNASGVFTRLAKPGTPAGEVLTFAASATIPSWAAAAGGGATILHDYTIQASTYTGGAPSGTTRSVFIRTIDANNEGIFVKIKKNGTAGVEVQIA